MKHEGKKSQNDRRDFIFFLHRNIARRRINNIYFGMRWNVNISSFFLKMLITHNHCKISFLFFKF